MAPKPQNVSKPQTRQQTKPKTTTTQPSSSQNKRKRNAVPPSNVNRFISDDAREWFDYCKSLRVICILLLFSLSPTRPWISLWRSMRSLRGRRRMMCSFWHICHPNSAWSVKLNDVKESVWWEATHPFYYVFILSILFLLLSQTICL